MPNTLIKDVIDRVRLYANEPSTNSKFTNAQLVKDIITPAAQQVYNDVFMAADSPVQLEYSITFAKNTRYYKLPTNLRHVNRIVKFNSDNQITEDWRPHSERESWGPGWLINGGVLEIRPKFYKSSETWKILYTPNADIPLHAGTTATYGANTLTLDSTPTYGEIDLRDNAYVGCMIRVMETGEWQENYITDYDAATGVVTCRFDWDPLLSVAAETVTYEIGPPPLSPILYDAIALRACVRMWGIKRGTTKEYEHSLIEYRSARKALRDQLALVQNRIPQHFERDTWDARRDNGRGLLWPH